MRAPVRNKQPRGSNDPRTMRVRRRLVAGVAVVGITVLAAGAPSVVSASSEVSDAQHLVDLAALNQQAVSSRTPSPTSATT